MRKRVKTPTSRSSRTPVDNLRLMLRAHIVQVPDEEDSPNKSRTARERPQWPGWPATVLAFDFETTVDPTQRLLFGSYLFAKWLPNGKLYGLREGLVYADDLKSRDPNGYQILDDYVERVNLANTKKKPR